MTASLIIYVKPLVAAIHATKYVNPLVSGVYVDGDTEITQEPFAAVESPQSVEAAVIYIMYRVG